MKEYGGPKFKEEHFKCSCGVLTNQKWSQLFKESPLGMNSTDLYLCVCNACGMMSIWIETREHNFGAMKKVGHPMTPILLGTSPHPDMPVSVKVVFEEARAVSGRSPRAAAALLRLATELLCDFLLKLGDDARETLNDKVGILVRDQGLSVKIQQALDSLRVVGNKAVHPGQLDFNDSPEIADKLFSVLNIMIEQLITQPGLISNLYDEKLTEKQKDGVKQRDKKTEAS